MAVFALTGKVMIFKRVYPPSVNNKPITYCATTDIEYRMLTSRFKMRIGTNQMYAVSSTPCLVILAIEAWAEK